MRGGIKRSGHQWRKRGSGKCSEKWHSGAAIIIYGMQHQQALASEKACAWQHLASGMAKQHSGKRDRRKRRFFSV